MKKFILIFILFLSIIAILPKNLNTFATEENTLGIKCKSAYLIDYNSGETLYSYNETLQTPIASVCKVMTLIVCFDEISKGNINYDDLITVSENAAGMGGSQVFLKGGNEYRVEDLIKSVIVCSANDSCVALSEAVCGSEDAFVNKMNETAKNLGCLNTNFSNCTGLPKPNQYSCAKDVAIMFRKLINNPDYFNYSKIWLEDFTHQDNRNTCMTNTNKLIRKYAGCDGGKTGFTNEAGFCLAATARKNNFRVVSVVLGADSSDNRFNSTTKLFEYAFANYKNKIIMDKSVNFNEKISVIGGNKELLTIHPSENVYVLTDGNSKCNITSKVNIPNLCAPVKIGQKVGNAEIYKDGVLYKTIDVLASESINKSNMVDNFNKIATNWTL